MDLKITVHVDILFITYGKQGITENDAYGMTVYARYTQKGFKKPL